MARQYEDYRYSWLRDYMSDNAAKEIATSMYSNDRDWLLWQIANNKGLLKNASGEEEINKIINDLGNKIGDIPGFMLMREPMEKPGLGWRMADYLSGESLNSKERGRANELIERGTDPSTAEAIASGKISQPTSQTENATPINNIRSNTTPSTTDASQQINTDQDPYGIANRALSDIGQTGLGLISGQYSPQQAAKNVAGTVGGATVEGLLNKAYQPIVSGIKKAGGLPGTIARGGAIGALQYGVPLASATLGKFGGSPGRTVSEYLNKPENMDRVGRGLESVINAADKYGSATAGAVSGFLQQPGMQEKLGSGLNALTKYGIEKGVESRYPSTINPEQQGYQQTDEERINREDFSKNVLPSLLSAYTPGSGAWNEARERLTSDFENKLLARRTDLAREERQLGLKEKATLGELGAQERRLDLMEKQLNLTAQEQNLIQKRYEDIQRLSKPDSVKMSLFKQFTSSAIPKLGELGVEAIMNAYFPGSGTLTKKGLKLLKDLGEK